MARATPCENSCLNGRSTGILDELRMMLSRQPFGILMKAYFFEINSILVFVDVVVGAVYPFACSRPIRGALILKSFIMIPSQAQLRHRHHRRPSRIYKSRPPPAPNSKHVHHVHCPDLLLFCISELMSNTVGIFRLDVALCGIRTALSCPLEHKSSRW